MKNFVKIQNKFYEKLSNFQHSQIEKVRYDADGIKLPGKTLITSVEEKIHSMLQNQYLETP